MGGMRIPDKNIVERLYEIFKSQKGKNGNVIPFVKKNLGGTV